MRLRLCLLAAVILGASWADGKEPCPLFDGYLPAFPGLREQWSQRHAWCPDDYCGKCLPHVGPCLRGCKDDYCCKPLPRVCPIVRGCVDDYCAKKCPICIEDPGGPQYTCGPPETVGGPCRRCGPCGR